MMEIQRPEPPLANCGAYLEKAILNDNQCVGADRKTTNSK